VFSDEKSICQVDAMDSLAVMGEYELFEDAVWNVARNVSFDRDHTVSVFETTIRVLGGLLSSHLIADEVHGARFRKRVYKGELLAMAQDLGNRLVVAFDTPTGIPFSRVNLRHGVPFGETTRTCTAGAGTLTLEFGLLSRLTGDERYEIAARGAVSALFARRSSIDLLGGMIDVNNGIWYDRVSTIHAGGDSFYEYLHKSYVLFGERRELAMFNRSYAAVQRYMLTAVGWYFEVDMESGQVARRHVDGLGAFWPGLQTSLGALRDAERVNANYIALWRQWGFLPESLYGHDEHGTRVGVRVGSYLLRPELIESTYLLYRATHDDRHLDSLQMMAHSLGRARTSCGYACVADVTAHTLRLEDRQDSFFLSETLKYLYLAFDDDNWLHSRNVVFTTEGHPFPVRAARRRRGISARATSTARNGTLAEPPAPPPGVLQRAFVESRKLNARAEPNSAREIARRKHVVATVRLCVCHVHMQLAVMRESIDRRIC
jgi:mannosidase alpha-like ER degradation enhancer 1